MKRIGILGGLGPESTIAYYSYITRTYYDVYNDYAYPEIIIYSLSFREFIDTEYELPSKVRSAIENLHKAGADFVITGHSHQYERFRPIAPPPGTNGSYVTYITSGGGGAPLDDVEPSQYYAQAKKIHHFCLFHIKTNKLTMDTIDINGRTIDHLEINKTNGRLNKEYLQTAVSLEEVRLFRDVH